MSFSTNHKQSVESLKGKAFEQSEISNQSKDGEVPRELENLNSVYFLKLVQLSLAHHNDKSTVAANMALTLMESRKYSAAINLWTEAITQSSEDINCYIQRGLCLLKANKPALALLDAEQAISLDSKQHLGFYIKGRAQILLKQFREAEKTFVEANYTFPCSTYNEQLILTRELALKELDFSVDVAEKFAKSSSSISDAIECAVDSVDLDLQESKQPTEKQSEESSVSIDQNLSELQPIRSAIAYKSRNDGTNYAYDVEVEPRFRIRPANILGMNGVFVGNISPRLTVDILDDHFKQFGNIKWIQIHSNRFSAFVHYDSPTAPVAAIFKLHAINFPGLSNGERRLVLRFVPGGGQTYRGNQGRKWTSRECLYWRTTGCDEAIRQCPKIHQPMCRGIDFQSWMNSDVFF
ncbi:hypothetical protein HDE_09433 [Halotydeus destructor]|nr:hypothetical protein HDE_09433 [Halotydeus destructor]